MDILIRPLLVTLLMGAFSVAVADGSGNAVSKRIALVVNVGDDVNMLERGITAIGNSRNLVHCKSCHINSQLKSAVSDALLDVNSRIEVIDLGDDEPALVAKVNEDVASSFLSGNTRAEEAIVSALRSTAEFALYVSKNQQCVASDGAPFDGVSLALVSKPFLDTRLYARSCLQVRLIDIASGKAITDAHSGQFSSTGLPWSNLNWEKDIVQGGRPDMQDAFLKAAARRARQEVTSLMAQLIEKLVKEGKQSLFEPIAPATQPVR